MPTKFSARLTTAWGCSPAGKRLTTRNGGGGRAGMKGADDQVARLRGGQGQAHGLMVAHLAHHDDIRVLAQGASERVGEAERVRAHPTLVDHGEFALVEVLDGVLDGDDVLLRWSFR